MRVVVVGSSSVGKTTFAKRLSALLGIPHIELDALYWGPNWTPTPQDQFRRVVTEITDGPSWVCDGDYRKVRDVVWPRAEVVIWLDYAFPVVLYRAFSRTLTRMVTREELFGGNRESVRLMFDRDWIPWWVIRTFHKRRRMLAANLEERSFQHLRVVILHNQAETDKFLQNPEAVLNDQDPKSSRS